MASIIKMIINMIGVLLFFFFHSSSLVCGDNIIVTMLTLELFRGSESSRRGPDCGKWISYGLFHEHIVHAVQHSLSTPLPFTMKSWRFVFKEKVDAFLTSKIVLCPSETFDPVTCIDVQDHVFIVATWRRRYLHFFFLEEMAWCSTLNTLSTMQASLNDVFTSPRQPTCAFQYLTEHEAQDPYARCLIMFLCRTGICIGI